MMTALLVNQFALSLLRLILGPGLHLIPAFLLALVIILLKDVCRHHSLFVQFVLSEQLFHDLVTKVEQVDTILEVFTSHEVTDTNTTIAGDG